MDTSNNTNKRKIAQAELKPPSIRTKKQKSSSTSLVDSLLSDLEQEAPKKM
jgi:hypothetical protein